MNPVITVENLSHSFGDHLVLKQITLRIGEGEIFGLLGPSGAGKTTLINILTGQLAQTEGLAELLGKDTRKLTEREHRQIGTMLDNAGLYERLSAYENLSFYADIYHLSRGTVCDLLKRFGLYEARKTPVAKLSKGMTNRLSLARALMNDAKVLFLDEPTSGLDPATMREIHAVLKEQKERGATIFLTTHNMFEAQSLCDNVALLSEGSLLEYASPADICKKYNRLNRIEISFTDGKKVSLENNGQAASLLKEYLEYSQIETIHSTEPTLETVFIELTGKGLD